MRLPAPILSNTRRLGAPEPPRMPSQHWSGTVQPLTEVCLRSNYIFAVACGGMFLVLVVLVLIDLKKKGGKRQNALGTTKG